jgi:hypothetical protein
MFDIHLAVNMNVNITSMLVKNKYILIVFDFE